MNDVTAENVDQVFETKQQAAIDAGASLSDINIIRGRIGLEPLGEQAPLDPILSAQPEKIGLPENAATDIAGAVSFMTSPEEFDTVKQELLLQGESKTAKELNLLAEQERLHSEVMGASTAMADPSLSPEQKQSIANSVKDRLKFVSEYNVVDEATILAADEAIIDSRNPAEAEINAKNAESLQQKLAANAVIKDVFSRAAEDALYWGVKPAADIARTAVSSADSVSIFNEIANILDVEVKNVLAPGQTLGLIKDYINGLSTEKQKAEAAIFLSDYLKENTGAVSDAFGSNLVERVIALADVFAVQLGEDPDGWWEQFDVDEVLTDLGPIVDVLAYGSVVSRSTFVAGRAAAVTQKLRRLANLPRLDAANSKKAAEVVEEAMRSEDAAKVLGTTKEDLKMVAAPKVQGWKEGQTSGRTARVIDRHKDVQEIIRTSEDVTDFITASRGKVKAEEALKEAGEVAKGKSFWLADTELTGKVGDKWKASALVGKTLDRGFGSFEEATKVLNKDFGGTGRVLTRTSRTEPLKQIVKKGKEQQVAIDQVKQELQAARSTKLNRGQQKAIRKEINNLSTKIAAAEDAIKSLTRSGASGTKASRAKVAEEAASIEKSIEPIRRELSEAEALLETSNRGFKAEQDISRLEQGHIDKLSPQAKERLVALQKDVIVQEASKAEEFIEYFVKADYEGDIGFVKGDTAISFGGSLRGWMFDADSAFSTNIAQAGHALFDKWKWAESDLMRHLEPFANLSKEKQIAISKVLAEGDKSASSFSRSDLKKMGIKDEASWEAYSSYRKFADIIYDLEDHFFSKKLSSMNMSEVTQGDDFRVFAEVLDLSRAKNVSYVYDPVTDSIRKVDINSVYKDGLQVGRLLKPQLVDSDGIQSGASHILLGQKQTKVQKAKDSNNLTRRTGYVPKSHQSNYFITKEREVVLDGVTITRKDTIGVAPSAVEAKKVVDNLNAEGISGYGFKHDRTLVGGDREFDESLTDLYQATGSLFYGKRSDKDLKGFAEAQDELRDPLAAAVGAASRLSRDATLNPFINDMKARFMASYGDLLENPRMFPSNASKIHHKDKLDDWRVMEARSVHAHIETLNGLSTGEGFRRLTIQTADMLDDANLSVLGKGLRATADVDPIGKIRAFNFNLNLRSNPITQLIVQPSQLSNMMALSPNILKDIRYGWALTKAARERVDLLGNASDLQKLASSFKLDVDTLKKDIKAFRESGMGQAVVAHETARDASRALTSKINESKIGSAVGMVTSPVKGILNVTGKGFERAEELNIGSHYLVARHRWAGRPENKGRDIYDTASQLEIAGEARALSGSMIQTGDYAYQKGIAAIPFQYAAIMHKQAALMTTNKALSKSDKAKLIAAQALLWGPAGLGLGGLVTWAANQAQININEGAAKFLNDGIAEWGLNSFLSAAFDEDVDLDLSGRFAPAAGLLGDNIYTAISEAIFSGEDIDTHKMVFGATYSNYNRIANGVDHAYKLFAKTEEPSYRNVLSTADEVLKVFSGYNQTTQALLFARRDAWLDSRGNKLFTPQSSELFFMGGIGVRPKRLSAIYDINASKRSREEHLNEVAEDYYKHIVMLSQDAYSRQKASGWSIMGSADAELQALTQVHKGIIDTYEEDASVILDKVAKKIKKAVDDNKEDELLASLLKLHLAHGADSSAGPLVMHGVNAGIIKPEQVEEISSLTKSLIGEE